MSPAKAGEPAIYAFCRYQHRRAWMPGLRPMSVKIVGNRRPYFNADGACARHDVMATTVPPAH